jgi:lipoprotein-anchoring transpeptidase ErfK/SrfK
VFKRAGKPLAIAAIAAIVLAGGAFAYDSSRDDLISKGVTVGGVPLGGLRADAAREKLDRLLVAKLERPVRVAVAGRRFRLTQARARLTVDVDGMVAAAVDRSREGGIPSRVWRGLTGKRVAEDLPAEVSYSSLEVRRFVRRVKRAVDRPARNADVKFATASLPAIPSRTGLRVDGRRLRRAVTGALGALGEGRTVRGKVKVVRPEVTTGELSKKYPYVVTIDRPAFRLRFFKDLKLAKTYKIAVGQVGYDTPSGIYHIQNKAVNPSWHVPDSPWTGDLAGRVIPPGPENPIKSRWMGIYDGAGIHGTDAIGSLGSAASHGCIRMSIPDVEELYDRVPVRTPVYIQ